MIDDADYDDDDDDADDNDDDDGDNGDDKHIIDCVVNDCDDD